MKRFDKGDLQRLANFVGMLKSFGEKEDPEHVAGAMFQEVLEVLDAHNELLQRHSRLKAKKEALGRQLNHVNNKLRETKAANKTLTQKNQSKVEAEMYEVLTDAVEIASQGGCCRA